MTPAAAWAFLIIGYALPLLHIGLSPRSGPWRAPQDSSCPFSPKIGWLVIVVFLGPIGWVMFMLKRSRGPAADS